jgi:hypothetical protein
VGLLDLLGADYTLMMFIIKALTFKMMLVIITALELAEASAARSTSPRIASTT